MRKKFIPNGDLDFAVMAEGFAKSVADNQRALGVSDEDAQALGAAVKHYRQAVNFVRTGGTKSSVATATKEEARIAAEKIIRRIANTVRASDTVPAAAKRLLGLRPRQARPKQLTVPNETPRLQFVQAMHHSNAVPEHELKFCARDYKSKPEGAIRLELFVGLIPAEAKIPQYATSEGAPLPTYLRSYTKSPIRLQPPMARKPMRVLYWARWADSQGNVGPMSETAAGWIEGGSHHLIGIEPRGFKRAELMEMSEADEEAREQHTTVVVALVQAQRSMMQSAARHEALPEPVQREIPQLEAPATEAA